MRFTTAASYLALGLTLSVLASCESTQVVQPRPLLNTGGNAVPTRIQQQISGWWNHPHTAGTFGAVGQAKIVGSEGNAESRAELQAKASLAVSLEAAVEAIADAWMEEVANASNRANFSSMLSDKNFGHKLVDRNLQAARIVHREVVEGYVACLVALEKPGKFFNDLQQGMESVAIVGSAHFTTDEQRDTARNALTKILNQAKTEAEVELEWRVAVIAVASF
jgi:hypothetical protein